MRALVKADDIPGQLEVVDLNPPVAKADEVLVAVERVGICGTDLGIQAWAPAIVREYSPILPHTLGHEFSGTVVAEGPSDGGSLRGWRVAVNPHLPCGSCVQCRAGRSNICLQRPILGCHMPGGAAEYVVVPRANLHRLPDNVSFELGALVEPTAVALHAVERADLREGMTVAVIGAGPIGVLCALVLQAMGYRPILGGTTGDAGRLDDAARRGLRTTTEEVTETDVLIEAAGSASGIQSALLSAKPGGTVVFVSLPHEDIPVDVASLVFRELTVHGSRAYTRDVWPRAISLISEKPHLFEGLVSRVYSLEEWDQAFNAVASRTAMKVQLTTSSQALGESG